MTAQKQDLLRGVLRRSRLSNPMSGIMARLTKPDYVKPIFLGVTLVMMAFKSCISCAIRTLRRSFKNSSLHKTSDENACLTLDPKICLKNESRNGAIFSYAKPRGAEASLFLLPTSFDFPRFLSVLKHPLPIGFSNLFFVAQVVFLSLFENSFSILDVPELLVGGMAGHSWSLSC